MPVVCCCFFAKFSSCCLQVYCSVVSAAHIFKLLSLLTSLSLAIWRLQECSTSCALHSHHVIELLWSAPPLPPPRLCQLSPSCLLKHWSSNQDLLCNALLSEISRGHPKTVTVPLWSRLSVTSCPHPPGQDSWYPMVFAEL